MKSSAVYSVSFTVVLCCVCSGLLTFANTRWHKLIAANEDFARIRAVVDALGVTTKASTRSGIVDAYRKNVAVKPRGEMEVYEARQEGKLLGYALELVGRGKYGPIKGILAIGPKTERIKSLRIYEQNETPGLGGRISSPEWLAKFAGLPLVTDGASGIIISSKVKGPNVVDAITGASKTTYSLGKLMNTLIARFLSGGIALKALDFKLGPDAVTRATPGYPKNLAKPPHLRQEVRRPDFLVPPEVELVSVGKAVTSSLEDIPIIGELAQLTDGIKKSGEFDYIELDPGPQWVQVDLGEEFRVFGVVVWHFYKNPVVYNDVIVLLSREPECGDDALMLFNNDHDNSTGLGVGKDTAFYARWWGELVDARGDEHEGTPARYVRVYTNGGCGGEDTRFVEIAVYGRKHQQQMQAKGPAPGAAGG